jgi:hypothetical protein
MLDTIRRTLAATIRTDPPTIERHDLPERTLRESLRADVPNYGTGVSRVRLDATLWAPAPDDVAAVCDTRVGWLPYESAEWDCEDFALATKVVAAMQHGINSVGVVVDHSGGHSYNLVVDSEGGVHLYEPQATSDLLLDENPFAPGELPVGDNYVLESGHILI